jgi:hypothetical protein
MAGLYMLLHKIKKLLRNFYTRKLHSAAYARHRCQQSFTTEACTDDALKSLLRKSVCANKNNWTISSVWRTNSSGVGRISRVGSGRISGIVRTRGGHLRNSPEEVVTQYNVSAPNRKQHLHRQPQVRSYVTDGKKPTAPRVFDIREAIRTPKPSQVATRNNGRRANKSYDATMMRNENSGVAATNISAGTPTAGVASDINLAAVSQELLSHLVVDSIAGIVARDAVSPDNGTMQRGTSSAADLVAGAETTAVATLQAAAMAEADAAAKAEEEAIRSRHIILSDNDKFSVLFQHLACIVQPHCRGLHVKKRTTCALSGAMPSAKRSVYMRYRYSESRT